MQRMKGCSEYVLYNGEIRLPGKVLNQMCYVVEKYLVAKGAGSICSSKNDCKSCLYFFFL